MDFKPFTRSLLAAAALLLCFTAAWAQEQPGGQSGADAGPGGGFGSLKERLGLSPEQLRQIREVRGQHEAEARALGRRVLQARRALDEAIYSDRADEALVEQRAKELAEAQGEATRLRAQVEWRIRRVLTPEQLSALRVMREQAQRDRLEQRRRRGPRRGPRDAFDEQPGPDAAAPARNPLRRLRRPGLLPRP